MWSPTHAQIQGRFYQSPSPPHKSISIAQLQTQIFGGRIFKAHCFAEKCISFHEFNYSSSSPSPSHYVQSCEPRASKPRGRMVSFRPDVRASCYGIVSGTNDAFVTMALGKEKFQTSVVEQAASDVEWREQADL